MDTHAIEGASEEVGRGEHAAFFFKTNAERFAYVIPYIASGLRGGERCVYIANENTVPDVLAEFQRAGIDIGKTTAAAALSVVTKHDAYLRHGIFEPERMILDFDRDVRVALQAGFTGLRATGEMTWALDLPSALGRLCEYESALLTHWPGQLTGLCQYNETLFPATLVEKLTQCHCTVLRHGRVVRHTGTQVA